MCLSPSTLYDKFDQSGELIVIGVSFNSSTQKSNPAQVTEKIRQNHDNPHNVWQGRGNGKHVLDNMSRVQTLYPTPHKIFRCILITRGKIAETRGIVLPIVKCIYCIKPSTISPGYHPPLRHMKVPVSLTASVNPESPRAHLQ